MRALLGKGVVRLGKYCCVHGETKDPWTGSGMKAMKKARAELLFTRQGR
jgi:hypothetical protein